MSTIGQRIAANVTTVRERIAAAARRAGRSPNDVALVAVTKYAGLPEIEALLAAGCFDLGESRPQALWQKAESLRARPIRWHLVGHLQRNKVARTLPLCELIHSVDSARLLAEIDREAARLGRPARVLLEVNTSGDAAKNGVRPDDLAQLIEAAAPLAHVRVAGLMTMASLEGDAATARRDFAALRALGDCAAANLRPNCRLDELSMGMSGDFEEAIEEGATIVRVGSALFE